MNTLHRFDATLRFEQRRDDCRNWREAHDALDTLPGVAEVRIEHPKFTGCSGDCEGQRDCTCGAALAWRSAPAWQQPIKTVEQAHPILWLLYATVIVGTVLFFVFA